MTKRTAPTTAQDNDSAKEPTPIEKTGAMLSIRTTVAFEEILQRHIQYLQKQEMREISRAEAGRRLLLFAMRHVGPDGKLNE